MMAYEMRARLKIIVIDFHFSRSVSRVLSSPVTRIENETDKMSHLASKKRASGFEHKTRSLSSSLLWLSNDHTPHLGRTWIRIE